MDGIDLFPSFENTLLNMRTSQEGMDSLKSTQIDGQQGKAGEGTEGKDYIYQIHRVCIACRNNVLKM